MALYNVTLLLGDLNFKLPVQTDLPIEQVGHAEIKALTEAMGLELISINQHKVCVVDRIGRYTTFTAKVGTGRLIPVFVTDYE